MSLDVVNFRVGCVAKKMSARWPAGTAFRILERDCADFRIASQAGAFERLRPVFVRVG